MISYCLHGEMWYVTFQSGQSAVHLASVGGHTETLKVLIEKQPQLNLQDQVMWNRASTVANWVM